MNPSRPTTVTPNHSSYPTANAQNAYPPGGTIFVHPPGNSESGIPNYPPPPYPGNTWPEASSQSAPIDYIQQHTVQQNQPVGVYTVQTETRSGQSYQTTTGNNLARVHNANGRPVAIAANAKRIKQVMVPLFIMFMIIVLYFTIFRNTLS